MRSRFLAACALLLATLACEAVAEGGTLLRIGSKRFTESYIVAQVLAQTAAPHAKVTVLQGLGNTAIVYEALRSGAIDLYPEYVGTIAQEILKLDAAAPATLDDLNRGLAPLGLAASIPLGFNDGYALAVRAADAARLKLRTLGDLAKHPDLRLGLSNEFLGRADGWKGLAARYGLPQTPAALDHGLAYDALAQGRIDAIDIYTTDARIGALGLAVLIDDRGYFPRYDAVVLHRRDVPARFPAAWAALSRLAGSIDERAMIAMNARAELEGATFETIARDHLTAAAGRAAPASGTATMSASGTAPASLPAPTATPAAVVAASPGFWAKLTGPDLPRLTLQHVGLVLASVVAATALGIPLAVAVMPHRRLRAAVLGASGLLQTVPSLALLAVLISLLGAIGTLPALLALTLYALLPILRNTCAGLDGVPSGLAQAALALGLSRRDRLLSIDLPLALPTVVAGLRTACALTIGTATIAAFIGAGGYGERIVTGLALNDRALLLAGALPAAALALLFEGAFEALETALARRHGRLPRPVESGR